MKVLCVRFGSTEWDLANVQDFFDRVGIEHITLADRVLRGGVGVFDVVIQLGLSVREDAGISFLQELCALHPTTPVLVASQHRSPEVEKKVRQVAPNVEFLSRQTNNPQLLVKKLAEMVAQPKTAPH